jgi:hypothetical protein
MTNKTSSPDDLLTRQQLADLWECDVQYVDARRRDGTLPWQQIGFKIRIRRADADAFKAAQNTTRSPE